MAAIPTKPRLVETLATSAVASQFSSSLTSQTHQCRRGNAQLAGFRAVFPCWKQTAQQKLRKSVHEGSQASPAHVYGEIGNPSGHGNPNHGQNWSCKLKGAEHERRILAGPAHNDGGLGVSDIPKHKKRRGPPALGAGSFPPGPPENDGGSNPKLPNSTVNILIAGFFFGLLFSGNLDFLDGFAQFLFGGLLTAVLLVSVLTSVLEDMVKNNEGMGANSQGNCPWCGAGQRVLDIFAVHEGKPVVQQCLACQGHFTVEKGVFVRADPHFTDEPGPAAGQWGSTSSAQTRGFGKKQGPKGKGSGKPDIRPVYTPSGEVVDIEAVVKNKE